MYLPEARVDQTIADCSSEQDAERKAAIDRDRDRRQIELVDGYRTRLIADAVTGNIDVREMQIRTNNTKHGYRVDPRGPVPPLPTFTIPTSAKTAVWVKTEVWRST